jgi:hypothetical protein
MTRDLGTHRRRRRVVGSCSVSFCCIFSVPVANPVLRVRQPRSARCCATGFVGNEAVRETNRAEMVVRRRANLQVSRGHERHQRCEPTSLKFEFQFSVVSSTEVPIPLTHLPLIAGRVNVRASGGLLLEEEQLPPPFRETFCTVQGALCRNRFQCLGNLAGRLWSASLSPNTARVQRGPLRGRHSHTSPNPSKRRMRSG